MPVLLLIQTSLVSTSSRELNDEMDLSRRLISLLKDETNLRLLSLSLLKLNKEVELIDILTLSNSKRLAD